VEAGVKILTAEDHGLAGGFGGAVLEACNNHRIPTDLIYRSAMPDRWMYHDSRGGQMARGGIDAAGIARRVREVLDDSALKPALPEIHVRVEQVKVKS
jgi:1-deoxy-D-xylulose-5-phosphate synthase